MISPSDRTMVRELARRVADIAALPVMEQRRQMWKRHNRLQRVRPMILIFPEGGWEELLPRSVLCCQDRALHDIEWELRRRIFQHEHLNDDNPISGQWEVRKAIKISSWGLEPKRIPSTTARGSWAFDPVLRSPDDLKKLRFPEVTVDEQETQRTLQAAHELFGDILDVRLVGVKHVSFHLFNIYIKLRGLDQTLIDFCDRPRFVHDTIGFLAEGYRRLVAQYVRHNLLTLNNDGTYHCSGGVGFTDELPQADCDPARVRTIDMWSSAEAQELAPVSPAMHEEFALRYERELLAMFGLNGYGCCEDLTNKLDIVLTIPRIRRISISPFANVDRCAERLGDKYIFSWKPHPAHLVGSFDAQRVGDYIRRTLDATRGCVIEMVLKDTHTCENHPERFTEWSQIARRLAEQY